MKVSTYGELILLGSAVYHLIMGALALFARAWVFKLSSFLYKVKFPQNPDPRYSIAVAYTGAFGISVGIISLGAYLENEAKLKVWVFVALAILFLARAAVRFFEAPLFEQAFQVSHSRNLGNVIFNAFLVATMLLFGVRL